MLDSTRLSAGRDAALDDLIDKAEIHDALLRYCRGVDRHDLELLKSAFHSDATISGATVAGNAWQQFTEKLSGRLDVRYSHDAGQHQVTNHLIELDGDRARSEAYFVVYLVRRGAGGGREFATVGGRYVDTVERRDGAWRIAHRTAVQDWSLVQDVHANYPSTHPWAQGQRDVSDASYVDGPSVLFGRAEPGEVDA